MSKGSKPRTFSVDQDTFASNWDSIFGSKVKVPEVEVSEVIPEKEEADVHN